MSADNVNTRTVMRAMYDLHSQRGTWPTVDEIRENLKTDAAVVRPLLRDLCERRLFKDRRRNSRVVWGPWSDTEFER